MTPQDLRKWRTDKNLSPLDLADALSCSRKTIYRWEAGQVPLPSDLAHRLAGISVTRDNEAAEKAGRPVYGDDDDASTETEHGKVIGLRRTFWRQWTDAQRVAWVMDPNNNPVLALPWPLWSHGWTFYPPVTSKGAKARPIPHYLAKWAVRALKHRMDEAKGTPDERLRKAVISLCRRCAPTWPVDKPIEIPEQLVAAIKANTFADMDERA